jgi:hypothetical protein
VLRSEVVADGVQLSLADGSPVELVVAPEPARPLGRP